MGEELEKKKMLNDSNITYTHENDLWILYRALSEEIAISKEMEKKIKNHIWDT